MKATILLLCYNHKRYVSQCLESITNQTYKDIEIIFLDNASNDGSYESAVELLAKSGVEYKAFRNEKPASITINLNFMLGHASGDYIVPFSADDWMSTDNIADKISLFQQKPDVGAIFGGGWWYYEDKDEYVEADHSKFKRGDMASNLMLDSESYFWCGFVYSVAVLKDVGAWDENLIIEDLDLNVRIALKYKIDFVPKPLVYYRRHSAAFTRNYALMWEGMQQFYNKHKNNKSLPVGQWMVDNYRRLGYQAPITGNVLDLFNHSVKSFFQAPSTLLIKRVWLYTKVYLFTLPAFRKAWVNFKKIKG